MKFTLQHKDPSSQARAGELQTDHGVVKTPIFMPVGTAATVKGIFHRDVRDEARAQIILANTYHLYLRPGMDILERAGGVHRFSTWDGPMLTDSGGFQVFSLAGCRKLKEEGCHFQSHIDGSRHLFTPESVIDTERTIGADIMMAFDECPPGDSPRDYAAKSLALTERWLDRCFNRYRQTSPKYGHYQALFPIVQGCTYPDLRARAAENVKQYDADGYAIGGLAVGEPTDVMYEMIEVVNAILPEDRPRYLMGVGTPINILEGIARGVDMFDCVMPTRNGRNGQIFTSEGTINIRNKKWEDDFSPDRSRRHRLRRSRLYESLPASSDDLPGDARCADRFAAQHRILPAAGHRGPPTHRGRGFHTLEGADGRQTRPQAVTLEPR